MTPATSTSSFRLLSILGLLAACSGGEAGPARDADSSGDDLDQRAATLTQNLIPSDDASSDDASSYLSLRRDLRRCAAPMCGGFFVARTNRLTTECADGSRSRECYVAELDFSALGLSAEQVASVNASPEGFVLRGEIVSQSSELGDVGRLNVNEAWQGQGRGERAAGKSAAPSCAW